MQVRKGCSTVSQSSEKKKDQYHYCDKPEQIFYMDYLLPVRENARWKKGELGLQKVFDNGSLGNTNRKGAKQLLGYCILHCGLKIQPI